MTFRRLGFVGGLLGLGGFVGLATTASCERAPEVTAVQDVALLRSGETANVVRIIKGDEFEVEQEGKRARVRMLGVHAFSPVLEDPAVQALSARGVEMLDALLLNKEVLLNFVIPVRDVHDRYLAYVEHAGLDVSQHLLSQGLAVVYTEYGFTKEVDFLNTEAQARRDQRQLWSQPALVRTVQGLRREWAQARAKRDPTQKAPADPLLQPLLQRATRAGQAR